MTRMPYLTIPALLFGGLLFAQPAPPMPPMPPMPPAPPAAPHMHHGSGGDVSVSIHDGKIEISGIRNLVDDQLQRAIDSIDSKDMPPQLRDKLRQRLSKVRSKVDRRLSHLKAKDLDELGEELGQMGEEIGSEMEGFGSDMDAWGQQFSKNMNAWGKQFSRNVQVQQVPSMRTDDDADDDLASGTDVDDDGGDIDADTLRDLGNIRLRPQQRDALRRLRVDSDQRIAASKQALAQASQQLHDLLDSGNASDAEISRAIDIVSQQEATIRKARILTWVNARRVLDDGQRQRVEGAAKSRNR